MSDNPNIFENKMKETRLYFTEINDVMGKYINFYKLLGRNDNENGK